MIHDMLELRDLTNAEILDGIREDAGFDYQSRVPLATQAGVSEVVKKLNDYRPFWNEFLNGFVNRIGAIYARNQMWQNPLSVFKKGLMAYGDTVEEYMTDLLEAHTYDPDRNYGENVLFGQERPNVEVNYHRVNRQDFYKVTINEKLMRRAFLNEGGLSQLIGQIMESPLKSDQFDEFLIMTKLFSEYEANGGFFKLNVPDFTGRASGETEAREALKTIKSMAYRLPILSRQYNAARLPMAAKPEDLVLIGTPDFLASIDVDGLAPIFHLDKATIVAERTIGLPEEYFGIDGAQGILTTKDFFMVFDTLIENRSQPNPAGLYDNYFLHHHGIYSASRFVPAILLTSDGGTVVVRKEVSVVSLAVPVVKTREGASVTTVNRGDIYALSTAVTTSPAGEDAAVAYSVSGNKSSKTYITNQGVLYVGANESASSLTVTAHSVAVDPTNPRLDPKTSTVTLTVAGDVSNEWPIQGELVGLTVAGAEVPGVVPGTLTYTLTLPTGTTVKASDVDVFYTGSGDVTKTVTKVDARPGYDVTVVFDPGTGAAKTYTVQVTVPAA